MKHTLFLALLLFTSFRPLANQDVLSKKVTLSVTDKELKAVLKDISKMTGARFLYSREIIQAGRKISISVRDKPLSDLLTQLLSPLQISFELDKNGYIFLNSRQTAEAVHAAASYDPPADLPPKKITGRVTAADGAPIEGASVQVLETGRGTATDKNGLFTLTVSESEKVLVVSATGFQEQRIVIGQEIDFSIKLKRVTTMLEDVVVVGYGQQRKRDITGSVASLKFEDVKNLPLPNLEQMLQGKVAGVTVGSNSGAPGSAISVRIRGITTIGSNEPLYVIDGQVVDDNSATFNAGATDASGGQTRLSPMSLINPSDIVSIDILKDASATAIYGTRASNGVVLITTKRGKSGDGRIGYDMYLGQQRPIRYLDVLNLREYAAYANQIADINGNARNPEFQQIDLLPDGTDWQREIFRPANLNNHQLSFSGGSDKSKYYISGGYFKQDGIIIGSGFERYTARLNTDNNLKRWFKIGNSFTVSSTNETQTLTENSTGVVINALKQTPNVPVYFPDGSFGGPTVNNNDPSGMNGVISGGNPVAIAKTQPTKINRQKLFGNIYAEITFLKHFTLRNEFGADVNYIRQSRFIPTYTWGQVSNSSANSYVQYNKSLFFQVTNYLTYKNTFAGKHDVTAMAGHEASKADWEWLQGFRKDFVSNSIPYLNQGNTESATNQNGAGHYSVESYFARVNYGYKDKYLLTATLRADASSRFGSNNRWAYFPSVAAAWLVTSEPFMENLLPTMSNLKLRLGYGAVGNQNIVNYAYGASLRTVASDQAGTGFGTSFMQNNIENPDVHWEATYSTNLGIDMVLFNRLNLTFDLYDKRSKDFLYRLPLPYYMGTGVPGQEWYGIQAPYVNTGEMQNRGIEISAAIDVIRNKQLTWNISGIFSTYKNKLLSLLDGKTDIRNLVDFNQTVNITAVGQPVGMFYGWVVDGIFQTPEELYNHPAQSNTIDPQNGTYVGDLRFRNLDTSKSGGVQVIDGLDRTVIGNPHPKFTFGFTNTVNWNGFDLSVFVQGSYGSKILNYNRKVMEALTGRENQFATVKNMYTHENPGTNIPRYINGDPNNNSRVSDRYIEDGSYLRLQNLTIGYTPPLKQWLKTDFISRFRIYGSVQNLFTLTHYTGYDPDTGSYNGNALLMNVDYGHYPLPRTITIGANVEF